MTRLKKKWSKVFILFLCSCNFLSDEDKQRKYFDSLDLNLIGIVEFVDIPENKGFNGFGMVRVSVLKSNFNYYDYRKSDDIYYCIIKNNKAEIFQFDLNECEIGDTIEVNTKSRIFFVHKKNSNTLTKKIILYYNKRFYKFFDKKYPNF